jgi:hypothetical protein
MNFGELKAEVRRKLRESTSSPVMWSDADIEQSLNEGLHELADATEFHEKAETVDLLLDHRYYDTRTLIPDFLVAGPAFNKTTNRWLIATTPHDLESYDLRWEERIAEPEYVMARGIWHLGYYPFKGVAQGSIRQYYAGLPDTMVEDIDVPPLHSSHHYALVEYSLWDLFAQDGEVDLAWSHWKEYLAQEAKVAQFMRGRGSLAMKHGWRDTNFGT